MPLIINIKDIANNFISRVLAGKFILTLDMLNFSGAENLFFFLQTLPAQQIEVAVNQTILPTDIFPATFSIIGQTSQTWPVSALTNQFAQITKVTLLVTQKDINTPVVCQLIPEGTLSINSKPIPITGYVIDKARVKFSLVNPQPNFSLSELADFSSNYPIDLYLPDNISIFNAVPLTGLDLIFGLGLTTTSLGTIVKASLDWELIPSLLKLKSLQASLQTTYTPYFGKFRRTFNGSIQAVVTIGQDFSVALNFSGRDFWELEVKPSQGNVLPAISNLANLTGDSTLSQAINDGLNALGLGNITIKQVKLGLNLAAKTLNYVSINGSITFAGMTLDIYTLLPDFQMGGSLAKDSNISFKSIIQNFFSVSDNFPEIAITEFSFFTFPKQRFYSISFTLTDIWTFDIASISLNQVSVDIEKTTSSTTGSISAALTIVDVDIFISGSNAQTDGGWLLEGSTNPGQQIPILSMVTQFLPSAWNIELPDSLKALKLQDVYVSFNTKTKDYQFRASLNWQLDEVDIRPNFNASFLIKSEQQDTTRVYSGAVAGQFSINDFQVKVGFAFADKNTALTFEITFKGITFSCTLIKTPGKDTILKAHISNLSLGEILAELVHLVAPGATFLDSSPWDQIKNFLDNIKTDNLYLDINLTKKTVGVEYNLNRDFFNGLPILHIDKIILNQVKRNGKGTVDISLTGRFFDQEYTDTNPLKWDLLNDKPPAAFDRSKLILDVEYLGIGQHVALDTRNIKSISQAINELELAALPPKDASVNPLSQLSKLSFSKESNWLIGAKLTIMETVALALVFNDPVLYGLFIGLQGKLAGALAGLQFEILYRKVTDSIGVYHTEVKLPDAMRRIELGAMTIILPVIAVDIYTNGNFRVDFGFPTNRDFSRSFCIQLFPFVGYGGFYFALLSGETSERVPRISNGRFDPVIEFGLGLSVGLGKTFERGPLKAGLTVTVEGILEGVIGWFQPNDPTVSKDRYFWIQGTIAIVGQLYGEVDFKIIQVSVSVVVYASVTLTAQAYEPIVISLSVGVSVSAKIKILFITIRFSFSFTLNTSFTIGSKSSTPWIIDNAPQPRLASASSAARKTMLAARSAAPMAMEAMLSRFSMISIPQLDWSTIIQFLDDVKPINLTLLPAFTVGLTEVNKTISANPEPKIVMLLAVKNSFSDSTDNHSQPFNLLVQGVLRWAIYALKKNLTVDITSDELKDIYADLGHQDTIDTAFNYDNIKRFIENNYKLYINSWDNSSLDIDATIFPILPTLAFSVDNNPIVDFSLYNQVDPDYDQKIAAYFQQLVTDYQYNTAPDPFSPQINSTTKTSNNLESLAKVIFRDYFFMLAKTAVQSAIDLLADNNLKQIAIPDLLSRMDNRYNNIAGMVSRFLLHGLRLPDPTSAIFKSLSVDQIQSSFIGQTAKDIDFYPLYQLTGQQFTISNTSKDIAINFTSNDSSGWVKFLTTYTSASSDSITTLCQKFGMAKEELFQLNPNLDSTQDITKALPTGIKLNVSINQLDFKVTSQILKDHLPSSTFSPQSLEIKALPLTQQIKTRYSLTTAFSWQSLEVIGNLNSLSTSSPLGLWWLSDVLFSKVTSLASSAKYKLATVNPSDGVAAQPQVLNNYTWATALGIGVQSILSEATKTILPNTYLMQGCDETDQLLLQKLWDYLNNSNEQITLYFLYDTSSNSSGKLVSGNINRNQSFLLKANLATLTTNANSNLARLNSSATSDLVDTYFASLEKADSRRFIKLLWETSLVGSGGFYWQYLDALGKGLPDTLFADNSEVKMWLVVVLDSQLNETGTSKTVHNFNNCVVLADSIDITKVNLFVEADDANDTTIITALSPGNIGFQVKRDNPEDNPDSPQQRTETLYHMIGYFVDGDNGNSGNSGNNSFFTTHESLPVGPTKQDPTNLSLSAENDDNKFWYYAQTVPIYKLATSNNLLPKDGLPHPNNNPYAGITADAQALFKLAFHDVYGNRISTNNNPLPLDVRYFDNIIGLAQWPGTAASYQFFPSANKAELHLELDFQTPKYIPSASNSYEVALYNASADSKKYEQIYYQINQDDFNVCFRTTLDNTNLLFAKENKTVLFPTKYTIDKVKLINFVSSVYLFLSTILGLKPSQISSQVVADESLYTSYLPVNSDKLTIIKAPTTAEQKSLADYAAQYNVSVGSLALVNASLYDFINVGVSIKIKDNTLITKAGETFNTLVIRFEQELKLITTIEEIATTNQDNTSLLKKDISFLLPPIEIEVITPINSNYIGLGIIFPILVGLEMFRESTSVYPELQNYSTSEFKDLTGVMLDRTLIVPKQSYSADGKLSLKEFAVNFEAAVSNKLKVAIGKGENDRDKITNPHLWAVNFGSGGITQCEIQKDKPQFFALKPLSNSLTSKANVLIQDYVSGEGLEAQAKPQNFQAIDLDIWMRELLAAIDLILSPQYAIATYQLSPTDYEKIINAKACLANKIKLGVDYLFTDENADNKRIAAQEALYQQLLVNLTNAYNTDVIVQYPIDVNLDETLTKNANLIGRWIANIDNLTTTSEFTPNYTFSSSKTALNKGENLVTTLFNTNLESVHKNLLLNLDYIINEIEYNISPLKNIDNYQDSSWLSLVIPISSESPIPTVQTKIGQINIPIPLRVYPSPPVILGQSGNTSNPNTTKIEDAKLWDYDFSYEHSKTIAAQDIEYLFIKPNLQKTLTQVNRSLSIDLFDKLAQFMSVYPKLKNDLALLLAPITPANKATILTAIKVFADLVNDIANVWSFNTKQNNELNIPTESYLYKLTPSINEMDDTLESITLNTIAAPIQNLLSWPILSIETKDSYFALASDKPSNGTITYQAGKEKIDASIAVRQKFTLKNLDITSIQNIFTGIYIKRNEGLLNGKTTSLDFVYQTPLITVPNSLTPFIEQINTIDISYDSNLKKALQVLFAKLFATKKQTYTLKLVCQYGYELVSVVAIVNSGLEKDKKIISRLPVHFHPKFDLTVDYSVNSVLHPQDEFLQRLTNTIKQWQDTHFISLQGGSYLFELAVYSTLDESLVQPIFQLKSLQYKLTQ